MTFLNGFHHHIATTQKLRSWEGGFFLFFFYFYNSEESTEAAATEATFWMSRIWSVEKTPSPLPSKSVCFRKVENLMTKFVLYCLKILDMNIYDTLQVISSYFLDDTEHLLKIIIIIIKLLRTSLHDSFKFVHIRASRQYEINYGSTCNNLKLCPAWWWMGV